MDLVRTSATQAERLEHFDELSGPKPVAESQSGALDTGTQDALMRFARFIHKEKKKKPVLEVVKAPPRKVSIQPYLDLLALDERLLAVGSNIDMYR